MNDTIQPITIEDDDPTDEQLKLAFDRACHEFGDCVADYEGDEFTKEFHDQLNGILNQNAIQGLLDKNCITAMVREDGQIGYILTPLGEEIRGEAERLLV